MYDISDLRLWKILIEFVQFQTCILPQCIDGSNNYKKCIIDVMILMKMIIKILKIIVIITIKIIMKYP